MKYTKYTDALITGFVIIMIFLLCLFTSVLFFSKCANAEVLQDGGGSWHIDTYPQNVQFQHLTIIRIYNPYDDTNRVHKPLQGGVTDSEQCFIDVFWHGLIDTVKAKTLDLILQIAELTKDEYVISLSMSVCHNDWYVIYLHDRKNFLGKEAYNALWQQLKDSNGGI